MEETWKLLGLFILSLIVLAGIITGIYFIVKPSKNTCLQHLVINKKCISDKDFKEMKDKLNSALCGGTLCTQSTITHKNNDIVPSDYTIARDGKYVELIDGNIYVTYVFTDQEFSSDPNDKSAQIFQLKKNSSGTSNLQTRFRPSTSGMWSNWITVI